MEALERDKKKGRAMRISRRSTTLLLIALAVTSLSACTQDADQPIAFASRLPEAGAADKALAADHARIQGFSPQGEQAKLVKYFRKFNQVMLNSNATQMEMETALQELRLSAKRNLEDFGHEDMRRLGTFLLEQFDKNLQALLAKASKTEGAATALLSGTPPTGDLRKSFRDFAELGGDFLVLAFANGLVEQKDGLLSLPPHSLFFIRLAFKVRWANVFPEVTRPLDFLLSDFERRWYEIWVAERSKTASKQRRLQAIRRLKVIDPDYAHLKAMGVVCYQTKDYRAAVAAFEKALKTKPGNKQLKSFLKQAKTKAQ